jgi:hypothetical protein
MKSAPKQTTIEMLGYRLNGKPRDDGSRYFTCADLPGFHFIVAAGEDPAMTMRPTLVQFVGLYRAAELKNVE